MAAKKRGLGRGLDALLAASRPDESVPEASTDKLQNLPLDLIQRGAYQPRTDMHPERLQELADSIQAQGVIQPIIVRSIGEGRYEIVAGERRWRAAQLAKLQEIPAVIREVPDDAALALALIENIQRENLNALEEASAYDRLLHEFQMTHQQIAQAVGKSRTTITNLLRLLELNDEVKPFLEHGDLEMGHARALLGLSGPAQTRAAEEVVAKGLSVRETEDLVRRLQGPSPARRQTPNLDPNVRRLQEDLSERLGARVQIRQGHKGKGKVSIDYNNLEELEGILAHIH